MEIIYVTVIGAGLGLLLRYVLPGRKVYGVLLSPALGAAVTAAAWAGMTWLGVTVDSPWIWVASLGAAVVVTALVVLVVSKRRESADARALHILSGGKA